MNDADIYPQYPALSAVYRRVRPLSFSWSLYQQLFASTEENVTVMNQSLPAFFGSLQALLADTIFLDIAALAGPKDSVGHPQASFAKVFDVHCADMDRLPAAAAEARKHLDSLKAAVQPILDHRHNRIAHASLAVYSNTSALLGVTNGQVGTVVDLAFCVFNGAAKALNLGGVCFDRPITMGGDGRDLLQAMRNSLAFHAIKHWCWTGDSSEMSGDQARRHILESFCSTDGWKMGLRPNA
jgi:hypothetical protein